jgi:protein-S-isoprenylcysteine O-methyltransferase
MNRSTVFLVIEYSWYVMLGVWLIGAFTAKPQVRTQPIGPRILHSLTLLVGFLLLYSSSGNIGFLGRRFAPNSQSIAETGMVLTIAGIAFAIWARLFLGTNWSAAPAVKEGHRLMRSGPYAIVRHPIYSGLLLAMLGTALSVGRWRCLLGLAIVGVAWHVKSRTEERYMEEEFGGEYVRYRSEVKSVIPFVL